MTWSQNYAPLGNEFVSALVAALPVVMLLGLLAFWHVRAHFAALAGLAAAFVIAVLVYHMPAKLAVAAGGYGAAFGLFPIGWIILNAIFIYDISVVTGQFEVLQRQVAGLSGDKRIQALLVAFCFGAFIEGAAGFGTPVAISGAIMIGLGFRPLEAAKLALIGNTAPVAFGALGTPLLTLAKITDLDLQLLSTMVGRQLTFFSVIVPFWLIAAQSGWRGMIAVWPACLVTGTSFAVAQFLMSNYHGPWLVNIVAAFASMASLILLMRFWRPADGAIECPPPNQSGLRNTKNEHTPWKAWLPWVCLSIFVFLWGVPWIKAALNQAFAPALEIPLLHKAVMRMPPVVLLPTAEEAVFNFNALSATGTALLCAGMLSGFALGLRPARLAVIYVRTLHRVRVSLLTIALMLALGFVTRYSGTDTSMGLAMAGTGWWFPFFSPIIGWLGVALTGSDTSSNVLFGNLQKVSAQQLHLSPILMASANSSGGVMGKMIDAQSIVVASVATGGHPDSPDAGTVLRSVFWHSLALAILVGLLVMLQAYVMTWMVPGK
ncbi:MAG TPA: lactate permease LctP family transporter [Verrucomicrobiaceae bacterium]|jgi:lactate permease